MAFQEPTQNLHRLLEKEQRIRREVARTATSRHSRFGTTISVTLNPKKAPAGEEPRSTGGASQPLLLHRQQAINHEAGDILDISKRQKAKKPSTNDELSREDNLPLDAKLILQDIAKEFTESCFDRE